MVLWSDLFVSYLVGGVPIALVDDILHSSRWRIHNYELDLAGHTAICRLPRSLAANGMPIVDATRDVLTCSCIATLAHSLDYGLFIFHFCIC